MLLLIPAMAFLYASVGHGGASGYLALMVIFGVSQTSMKPSALILNIFVSGIAFVQFYRKGFFDLEKLWPFILFSIPMSFIGAKMDLNDSIYKWILSACLLLATLKILGHPGVQDHEKVKPLHIPSAMGIGGAIGFISGMIGIGGGILLSPVLLLLRWASIKQSAALSAVFIFLNSVAGLAGAAVSPSKFNPEIYLWAILAIAGGALGAWLGSHKFNSKTLRVLLSLILIFASVKLLITF